MELGVCSSKELRGKINPSSPEKDFLGRNVRGERVIYHWNQGAEVGFFTTTVPKNAASSGLTGILGGGATD